MKKFISVAISFLLLVVTSEAGTITVDDDGPADYDNIQAAINAAVDGDIIIVSDGKYAGPFNRKLFFNGKAVTLQSENGAQNCIIDCENQSYAFNFSTGEGNGTIIDGFTISNGNKNQGGAIYCNNQSSPTIINCILQNNNSSYGGGVYCTNSSSPIITNCTIRNNTANSYGGGMYCTSYASPAITNCTIQDNTGSYGGAIYCTNYAALEIAETTIRNNTALSSYAGGIYCRDYASIDVLNSIISGNSSGYYAGGVYFYYGTGTFTNTLFTGNSSYYYGGGLRIRYSTVRVTNCNFHNNTADYGGGIYIASNSDVIVANTIFSENDRYGICIDQQDWPILENCLFHNNSSGNVYDWWYGDTLNSGSEINQNPKASSNGEGDPLFAFEDDFHLIRGSMARDAGNDEPTGGLPETDKDGNPRKMDGGRGRIPHVDIGAYEFNKDVPAIAVSPSTIEFVRERNAGNPDNQIIQIRNCGGETLNWNIEVEEDCSWLTVDSCTGDSTSEIDSVNAIVHSNGIPRGIYSTTLSITDPESSNSPRTVSVTLRIKGTLNVPNDYPGIQSAVNAAMEGETVEVESGTYNESVTINKKLKLMGLGSPVINAAGSDAVTIGADECVLDGFEITGGNMGVRISSCNNNIIRNNVISSNNDTGVYVYDSSGNTLSNNQINNNRIRGLYLYYSDDNVLRDNIISGSLYNFDIYEDYNQDIDTTNTVNGKSIYFLSGQDNVVIDLSSNAGCVYLIECSNMTVRDLTLSNNGTAVALINTNYSNIEDVNAADNNQGIMLRQSGNNQLINNIVVNNNVGILLSSSGSCTFRNNTCIDNQSNFLCQGGSVSDYQQDIDTSNTVDGKIIYYLVGQSNVVLDSSSNAGCVYAVSCNNITVQDVNISNGEHGVLFVNTSNSSVDNAILTFNNTAGVYLLGSSSCVIKNSDILNNSEGIYLEDSSNISVENCTINYNNYRGIYCYASSVNLENCTVNNNRAYGLYCYYICNVNMKNCTINNNNSGGIECYESSDLNLSNCIIKGNSGMAGIYFSWENNGSITNCSIYENTGYYGGIFCDYYNNVTIANSIIWESMPILLNYEDYATVSYCNIQGGYQGNGNINELPLLTPDGHLCSDSPCIDNGDPLIPYTELDIDGESRSLGGISDIGADEFIDTDSDKLPNFWEDKYFDPNIGTEPEDDPDGDEHTNINEYIYYSSNPVVPCTVFYVDANRPGDPNDPNYIGDGLSWETAKRTIMSAVYLTENSDKIIIAPGTYTQQVNLSGKQIITQSKDPTDTTIVDSTILRRRLTFQQGESRGCIIDGLTLSNAIFNDNYAIICENSSPTISNCHITNNLYGIVCNNAAPLLTNCNISGNYAESGGGLYCQNSKPEVRNSVINGNIAVMGGGIYCDNSELTIGNSLITGNASQYEATAIFLQESTLNMNQCTVADNIYMEESPAYTSAIYGQRSSLNISNSIIWNDAGSQIRSDYTAVDLSYNNIKGGAQGILGYAENHSNINVEPMFAENGYWTMLPSIYSLDPNANWIEGDYHLKSQGWRMTSFSVHDVNWVQDSVTSRCIDAGNPGSSLADELLTTPIDPNHDFGRNVRVNMGAYGGTNQASMSPNNWVLSGDLNNDGTIDFADMAQWSGSSFPEDIDNPADLNRNKIVDMADLMILTQDWLKQTSWF